MPIKIAGTVTVDAPRQEVWDLLFDLEVMRNLAARVPGIEIERLEQADDEHYEGIATVGIAAIKGKYDGKVTILEKREPEFIRVRGESKGGGNWSSGEGTLMLTEQDGHTKMDYAGQGNVSGPLASVGQRLVDTIGKQFINQGAQVFAEEIAARHRAKIAAAQPAAVATTAPRETVAEPVAQISTARGFAIWQLVAIIAALLLVALVIYLNVPH